MFRVLVTDASYKHSIALARYARSAISDLYLIGHTDHVPRLARWYSCFDSVVSECPLEAALVEQRYDIVVPVGGESVLTVARTGSQFALLPTPEQLELCFDKARTVDFAQCLDVPVPQSFRLENPHELQRLPLAYPCVVKPAKEAAGFKGVAYCLSYDEAKSAVSSTLARTNAGCGAMIQEMIAGTGCGLFALMDRGAPLRVFMHQRIREFPFSGGRSTAARAFYSPRLKELGLRLLTAMKWHGVAMVEFKYNRERNDFVLIEINGKFWGSLELALSAGVNFGADLIRLFRGERLVYSEQYDQVHEFYWPLDDDVLTLWQTGSLKRLRDYWNPNAHTNLFQSVRADALKSMRLVKKVVVG